VNDDDVREMLRTKADDMRIAPGAPRQVLRRSRRRRRMTTAIAGGVAVLVALGAFAGVRAATHSGAAPGSRFAGNGSPTPTPTVIPSASSGAIDVSAPSSGETVTSPITVSGDADVFEAVVSIRILDDKGATIADTTTMASCGSGCRGTYSAQVPFSVAKEEAGTIMVFEASAKDGTPINVVRIPVTLEPGGAPSSETGFDGIWPADDDAQLAALRGNSNYADPIQTATAFAVQILGWSPSDVTPGPGTSTSGDQSYVVLWNPKLHSPYDRSSALNFQLRKAGDIWIVRHVDTGLFDLLNPSIRQDVVVASSQQITGQFAQGVNPSGWKVTAVLMPAGTGLTGSEAEQTADIPISGSGFDGKVSVPPTSGGDVELVVSVTNGNGETLGLWARRLSTAG